MTEDSGGIRVLHVEDDPAFAETAAMMLEREAEEFAVDTATSADEGLERLSAAEYDCIVSDFDLGVVDGIEFLRSVREERPELPFILYTGKGSEEVASEAISAGVTDYLQKETGRDQYAILANRVRNAVDRHRATEAVRETEAWITRLLEHSSDYLFVVDETGSLSYVSPAIRRVMGYDPEELTGASAFEFTHPDDIDRATAGFAETLEDPDEEVTVQFRAFDADGNVRWLEVRGRNLLDDPIVEGVLVNVRDITHRRELRNQLERERDRFQAVFEQAFDAMVIADDDGRYVDANESAVKLFGVPKEELLGSTVSDYAPEGFDVEAEWAGFQSIEQDRGTFPLVRPDGTRLVVEYAATANVAPGQHLSILRDITDRQAQAAELRRVRERMEFALETTDSVIFELDAETWTETRHGPFERIYGLPSEAVSTPESFYERAVHPEDRERVETLQADVIEGRTDGVEVEYRTHPDGGTVEWIRSSMARRSTDEAGASVIGLSTVITPLKERESALERQNERLDQFASFLSHDLRNPLNVAEGRLALAREDHDDEDLESVARAHDRMRRLIDDLLSIARGGEVDPEPVDLDAAVARCWEDLEPETATLRNEVEGEILADGGQLQQVLTNLVGNAIEHGGDEPTVTVGPLPDGFYVEDDGPGIPAADRDRVFDRGFSTADAGTGLGLSIVHEIAEDHGWTVEVAEGSAGGARVEITGATLE